MMRINAAQLYVLTRERASLARTVHRGSREGQAMAHTVEFVNALTAVIAALGAEVTPADLNAAAKEAGRVDTETLLETGEVEVS